MIKKMFLGMADNTERGVLFESEPTAQMYYRCEHIKPVWVSDRDPFENVRKEITDDIDFTDLLNSDPKKAMKVWIALGKDLKNTEGAG